MDKQNKIYASVEYCSSLKRKEILSDAAACISFEDIMLSEVSQSQKDEYCMTLLKKYLVQ